jgi:ESF2/ABP1 family protein
MVDKNKRDWFATGDSDDEEQGYESDIAEESKGRSFTDRSSKRRKLEGHEPDIESDDSDNEAVTSFETAKESLGGENGYESGKEDEIAPEDEDATTKSHDVKSALSTEERAKIARKLARAQAKASKTGVLYISRVPPFMKPHTLRHLLVHYAPSGLDRVFLTPQEADVHKARVKAGGNKKKFFLDGWVEFTSKREAKLAAETLNGKNIGGKKGNYYYDDVWNLKYLKGFKWRHLTEQIANENAERSARLRAETTRERKEAREFLRNVERGKMLDGMERKRKIRGTRDQRDPEQQSSDRNKSKDVMQFRQSEAITKSRKSRDEQPSVDTQRVLSKIF